MTTSQPTSMTEEVFGQARTGSITAIIQILNTRLAEAGIRTRAVLEAGILQLLCEASNPAGLDQTELLPQVQAILEEISPRNIAQVRVFSRINREQQLLWLKEVQENKDDQVLWTADLKLKKPPFFKQLTEDWHYSRQRAKRIADLKSQAHQQPSRIGDWSRSQRSWPSAILGGLSVAVVVMGGWLLWNQWAERRAQGEGDRTSTHRPNASPGQAGKAENASEEPFVVAVRMAEKAAAAGQTASTNAEWLDLAARWQKAADLMAEVPANDPRYPTAQDRVIQYGKNSQAALAKTSK